MRSRGAHDRRALTGEAGWYSLISQIYYKAIHMEPKTMHVSRFFVSGLTVRTRNREEFNQETAKIPGLWAQFFSGGIADKVPNRLPDAQIAASTREEKFLNGL